MEQARGVEAFARWLRETKGQSPFVTWAYAYAEQLRTDSRTEGSN